jgi:hypothetical protein
MVPVLLPGLQTEVRITRAELEAMVRPSLASTIAALERSLRSAQVTPDQLSAVVLAGGASRMPLVAEMVGAALGRPVVVDTHPKHAVSLGAALAARAAEATTSAAGSIPEIIAPPTIPPRPLTASSPSDPPAHEVPQGERSAGGPGRPTVTTSAPPPPPVDVGTVAAPPEPADGAERRHDRRRLLYIGAPLAAVVVVAGALIATRQLGDDDDGAGAGTDTTTPISTQAAGDYAVPPGFSGLETPVDARAEITDVTMADGRYLPTFVTESFTPDIEGGDLHVHLFWNSTPVAEAGAPSPGPWLMWDEPAQVDDEFFDVTRRPADADAICIVVVDAAHQIADIDGDRARDMDTGNCHSLPGDVTSGTEATSSSGG